ncbi:MAG: hypothetical protein JOY70_08215, partial [Acidisphaera sp.]|nr:hypothetical protein [Acidisphaera sp.]MBV9811114.1 hypothetical protein [Acetobacteraceae bacterium]
MRLMLCAGAAALLLSGAADGSTLTTLSFSGAIYSIYDPFGVFGSSQTSYNSGPYSGTLSYDPTTFAACTSHSACTFTLSPSSSALETFTFNGHMVDMALTAGTLQFQSGGGYSDQITLNDAGQGISSQLQFGDG